MLKPVRSRHARQIGRRSQIATPRLSSAGGRCGTIYLAVLGVALIVSALGAAAIHVARIELHDAVRADEMMRARLAAQSGIEYGMSIVNTSDSWRDDYTSGVANTWRDSRCILADTGSFAFTFTDSDGDLTDDEQDSVTLRSVGTAGDAECLIEVGLSPAGIGLDCLSSSLHSQGTLRVTDSIDTNQRVSANSNIDATGGGAIDGDAAAMGTITGPVSGNQASHISTTWEIPEPDDVFEYYTANGTWIPVGSLASGNSIREVLLSPTNNPYGVGTTNEQGIYVIDCQGVSITIRDCRIVGTLVLLDAGPGTNIKDKIIMEPAIANFPSLLIQGPLEMDWDHTKNLVESVIGVILNLGGGSQPSGIKGLVYLTGDLLVKNQDPKVDGVVVVGGTTTVESDLILNYDATFYTNPPPGFAAGSDMKIVPGTWKRMSY